MDLLFINQEAENTGCGIAVIAMILQIPFKSVSARVNELQLCKHDQKVTVFQMKEMLKLIFDVDKIPSKRAKHFDQNKNYVCYCRWEGKKFYHWIIYANRAFYDPLEKMPVPVTKHLLTSLYLIPDKSAHSFL
ncbi:hypothetical protein FNI11_01750 [Salmonella enterica subsp. salamae]|nr:hypothetical protein [Salmonella enterica subsp. salamae]ECJ2279653.1 hypothetical protein [Salmonella enterica subsp. salamae]HCC0887917.1 hypothetical protein [Salmonella enterica]